jgi:hypothetical protein
LRIGSDAFVLADASRETVAKRAALLQALFHDPRGPQATRRRRHHQKESLCDLEGRTVSLLAGGVGSHEAMAYVQQVDHSYVSEQARLAITPHLNNIQFGDPLAHHYSMDDLKEHVGRIIGWLERSEMMINPSDVFWDSESHKVMNVKEHYHSNIEGLKNALDQQDWSGLRELLLKIPLRGKATIETSGGSFP